MQSAPVGWRRNNEAEPMAQQARRLDTRLSSDGAGDDEFWSWTLRLLFLIVAATACWAVPVLLIKLLAF
jgi:hypothetical protein